jgi:four helix bundle protein
MDQKPETIRDYRDLVVWKEAMDIAVDLYSLTRGFPREELFGITSQMRRCAASIPANIAEGFGRAQRQPFIQFLRIAQGSLKELETHTILCGRIELLAAEQSTDLQERCERLGKRLGLFVRSLERTGNGR